MIDNRAKYAFLLDNEETLYYATIDMVESGYENHLNDKTISVTVYDMNDNEVGYTRVYPERNLEGKLSFYYDVIYVYDKYRNKGIGTKINELVDYLLRNYEGHLIRGIYAPENSNMSKEEVDKITKHFHNKGGYQVITTEEFNKHSKKYPHLTSDDFVFDEFGGTTIVAKIIEEKEYQFIEHNDNLLDKKLENKKLKTILTRR